MTYHTTCCGCERKLDENGKYTAHTEDGEMFCRKCTADMSQVCCKCGTKHPVWDMYYVGPGIGPLTDEDGVECERCHEAA